MLLPSDTINGSSVAFNPRRALSRNPNIWNRYNTLEIMPSPGVFFCA